MLKNMNNNTHTQVDFLIINVRPDGLCKTLVANYKNCSLANFVRNSGTYALTGVIEIVYETD